MSKIYLVKEEKLNEFTCSGCSNCNLCCDRIRKIKADKNSAVECGDMDILIDIVKRTLDPLTLATMDIKEIEKLKNSIKKIQEVYK